MAHVHHLKNAPIREALLDIRVELPAEFTAAVFKSLKPAVGDNYPKVMEGTKYQTNLAFGGGKVSADDMEMGLHSIFFSTADDKTIAQFRADGFTFNRLRPYTEWDSLFPEAMRLWDVYASTAKPASATRIAVRFINEFDLPVGIASLSRYLRYMPSVVPQSPGQPKGFLSRVVNEDSAEKTQSVVTYSINESGPATTHIVFDIDVSRISVATTSGRDLLPMFARLRDIKNAIFFDSLTDETISQFE